MKIKKFHYGLPVCVAAMAFLAAGVMAEVYEPVSEVSTIEVSLNTLTHTSATDAEFVQDFDTRTYTEDLSDTSRLDTRPIISSMILIR